MKDRARLLEWLRGELIGPSVRLCEPTLITFNDREFTDSTTQRQGPLAWLPTPESDAEEILYYQRETPHRKFGAGLLHPEGQDSQTPDRAAVEATDTLGIDPNNDDVTGDSIQESDDGESADLRDASDGDTTDDFDVTSPDVRHPSTLGISFCVRLDAGGRVILTLPQQKRFQWQSADDLPFAVNGRYERCVRRWVDEHGHSKEAPVWRRRPAVNAATEITIDKSELIAGRCVQKPVPMPEGSPTNLRVECFPRQLDKDQGTWLLTVVLRNGHAPVGADAKEAVLYQTYFEARVSEGTIEKYPESQRPFAQLDPEEQSLALLYRESATWAIGHGCAAGWNADPGESPEFLYADVFPAVELPSMTPDIADSSGKPIQLSMRALAMLSDDGQGKAWESLDSLASEYGHWIGRQRLEAAELPDDFQPVAARHLDAAESCLNRIKTGVGILRSDNSVRRAFRLANLAMLLQQIATKQIKRRSLCWEKTSRLVRPEGQHLSPWDISSTGVERPDVGAWRAFQIAFFLMSIEGMADAAAADREMVDLIWFPTGGGKTEAYLGVMAFYMFHQRFAMTEHAPQRDGTNVLMRYTLRMLTTQQFQRAASLICAMEFLRRNRDLHGIAHIPGQRFSLGLWIGGTGSPNKIRDARNELASFRSEKVSGNPLILTECPWCRSQIGRFDGPTPSGMTQQQWNTARTRGITDHPSEGPLLHCTDAKCAFGAEQHHHWLPVEVIDERIYQNPPSLVIATVDKLAMVAFRPDAGAIFGRCIVNGQPVQAYLPPGLIVQDELHLISGPLGTMYALYEGIFERLCSQARDGAWIKPKVIASTATIRGAADQVLALYARKDVQLFPSPGLMMGDSFFGTYARLADGGLSPGRLYLGIHANDYGSVLTTQVRTFSSALFRPSRLEPEARDPWWTLLVFYNSIRELGGAKTLFDSDIISRLKFLFNREGVHPQDRRYLRFVEELTSRLSQAEIVAMLDRLSTEFSGPDNKALDACLASSIIEVGVDIDRLSIMGVVGQPKTTAQYIQVTGRVGRRWWQRPGLILMIYNPSKSRDRSHFEQFHSYHRRLYERVEPTTATPFALSAIERGLPGALLVWARQQSRAPIHNVATYERAVDAAYALLRERCQTVQPAEDRARSLQALERVWRDLKVKWDDNPQDWEKFPPAVDGEYLMLWPGQFATAIQRQRGVTVPSSMRQVDGSAELAITQAYSSPTDN